MDGLVKLIKNDVFTDSLVIAKGTNNQHHAIRELIKKYRKDIEDFGTLLILNEESTVGRPTECFQLNEEQATFLITLLRNSKTVVAFKKELVKQFYAMRQLIMERNTQTWVEQRETGKLTREAETDVIQQLVEYAKEQGSTHADKLYITYSRLANKMAGISGRDNATFQQLNELSFIENIILNQIRQGMNRDMQYKDIYKDCKRQIELFKDIAYLQCSA